jgi:hypothetical protein
MHNKYPKKFENCACNGIANGFTPPLIYCQSKHIERSPSPSFPFDPPNTRVKSWEDCLARQKMERPVRRGKIHSGIISQKKMLWVGVLSMIESMCSWK